MPSRINNASLTFGLLRNAVDSPVLASQCLPSSVDPHVHHLDFVIRLWNRQIMSRRRFIQQCIRHGVAATAVATKRNDNVTSKRRKKTRQRVDATRQISTDLVTRSLRWSSLKTYRSASYIVGLLKYDNRSSGKQTTHRPVVCVRVDHTRAHSVCAMYIYIK